MDKEQALFEQIEAYLSDRLTPEETQVLEQQMAHNEALAQQVAQQRLERKVLQSDAEEAMYERMRTWDEELANNPTRTWLSWWLLLVPLLAGLAYWSWPTPSDASPATESSPVEVTPIETSPSMEDAPQTPTPAEDETSSEDVPVVEASAPAAHVDYLALATTRYELPAHLQTSLRSVKPVVNDTLLLEAGIAAYESGATPTAIIHFQTALAKATTEGQALAQEWLGHAYFKNGQYDEAAEAFAALHDLGGNRTQSRADWYRLLALLPNHNKHQQVIETLLEKIIDPNLYHNRREQAIELQRAMQ